MVALSVSISASTSPFFTVSPTFLFHPAITPTSIVSLSLGIKTTSSILEISSPGVVGEVMAAAVTGVAGAVSAADDVSATDAALFVVFPLIKELISSPTGHSPEFWILCLRLYAIILRPYSSLAPW